MALTDMQVRKAKQRDKPYKMHDSLGLFVLVNPSGSKLWRQKYKMLGKEKVISHGAYPTVSLSEARRKRDEIRRQIESGRDPAQQKKLDKIAAETENRMTFKLVAEEFLEDAAQRDLAPREKRNTKAHRLTFPNRRSVYRKKYQEMPSPKSLRIWFRRHGRK